MSRDVFISVESARSIARSSIANALAQAFVDGVDNANQEKRPLTLLQQQDMLAMAMYVSQTSMNDAADQIDVELALKDARNG